MIRTWYRVVMLVWVCTVLLGHAARAEEAQPLQSCVLVLPLQASPEMSGDQVFLGLAVQNVLENVLAVHSTLEECRALQIPASVVSTPAGVARLGAGHRRGACRDT